jgi:hypothetical protein
MQTHPLTRYMGCVYFLRRDDEDLVKIGSSCYRILRQRIRTLESETGTKLHLMGTLPSPWAMTELGLHDAFVAYRVRGEWFQLSPEILDFIEKETTLEWPT